jgi:hypothetical protein
MAGDGVWLGWLLGSVRKLCWVAVEMVLGEGREAGTVSKAAAVKPSFVDGLGDRVGSLQVRWARERQWRL